MLQKYFVIADSDCVECQIEIFTARCDQKGIHWLIQRESLKSHSEPKLFHFHCMFSKNFSEIFIFVLENLWSLVGDGPFTESSISKDPSLVL